MSIRLASIGSTTALGVAVVGSYIYLAQRADNAEFWGPLKGTVLGWWALSALMTAASFLYVWVYVYFVADRHSTTVWGRRLEDSYGALLAIYMVFMVAASLWVMLSVLAKRGVPWASQAVTAVLWLTALASMALFVMMVGTREPTLGVRQPLAVIAGAFLAFHHIIWDAQLWRAGWMY